MNPSQQQTWKRDALDVVFSALADSSELSELLVYKGARILAMRLGEWHRASYDLDANIVLTFAQQYPDRAEQVNRLQALISEAIEVHVNTCDPVRFALMGVKVKHRPRESHPLGWNAFDVAIQLHDYANEGVRRLPVVSFDIAAPERLGEMAVAPLMVGERQVYAYTFERIAGEKLRAFLSSLASYRAKVKKPGESVRVKDIYDVSQILRVHSIADETFWRAAGSEFRLACSSRYIDCAGIATFEEGLHLTRSTFETEPVLPKDIDFDFAWDGIRQIVAAWEAAGIIPFEHPIPLMATSNLTFKIAPADTLDITDLEIEHVLTQVYVVGGFTPAEEAASLFEPSAVRKRGIMIAARDDQHSNLAGFVIVVPPDSPARRLAGANEGEVHLLGVLPEYRAQGLGRMLVDAAIEKARELGYSKLILWTQPSMSSAQRLYESAGFRHVDNFERNGRQFKLYERVIVV